MMTKTNQPARSINLIESIYAHMRAILSSTRSFVVTRAIKRGGVATHEGLHEGLYQILDYDLALNIEDKEGREAVLRRRQVVRFLQDHVIAYQDEAWGDGEVVAEYHCYPGIPVDFFAVGARRMILISLRQAKNRGDVVEFNIERRVREGFTKNEEWLEVQTRYPTQRLRISVFFPRGRPCQRARLIERHADQVTELSAAHFSRTSDGRQVLSYEILKPSQSESYTIVWIW
jgi:hypothetical protein